jgi:hypothetical protein
MLPGSGRSSSRQERLVPQCPKPPAAPPGANVDANIREAEARNSTQVEHNRSSLGPAPNPAVFDGARWFFGQVSYSQAPWDYQSRFGTASQSYNDFGNFNYGATGRAAGFGRNTLLALAGWAQAVHEMERGTLPTNSILTNFDDPVDQTFIDQGIDYYEMNCQAQGGT